MEQKLTPQAAQDAFDNITRALNFFKPLAYISESLSVYLQAMKEKEPLEKQLEEYRKEAEKWKKQQEKEKQEWEIRKAETIATHKQAAMAAIKYEEEILAKLKENIQKEKEMGERDLEGLKNLFLEKKHAYEGESVKIMGLLANKQRELDNLEKVKKAKEEEIQQLEISHNNLFINLTQEKEKMEAEYSKVVEKFESLKKAALALGS